jgi:DNA-directed RNA polymerase subunit H (RpoH/RPB5)
METKLINASKTITEYCILRANIRNEIFEGFEMKKLPSSPISKKSKVSNDLDFYLLEKTQKSPKYVFFIESLGIKNFKKYIQIFNDNFANKGTLIIIYNHKTTESDKLLIKMKDKITVDIFSIDELQFNIFESELSPKQIRILNQEERKQLLEHYKIKHYKEFPIIFLSDKTCKYLGCKKHDLIIYNEDTEPYIRCVI